MSRKGHSSLFILDNKVTFLYLSAARINLLQSADSNFRKPRNFGDSIGRHQTLCVFYHSYFNTRTKYWGHNYVMKIR